MKKILILAIFLFSFALADEDTFQPKLLEAKVQYNEVMARIEAFKDVKQKIDKSVFEAYLKDYERTENLDSIKHDILVVDNERVLCPFYLDKTLMSYAITYYERPEMNFYYNILGSMIKFEIVTRGHYPRRTLGYSRFGNLLSVSLEVSPTEQFIYDEKGKLIAHWVDNKLVDTSRKMFKKFDIKRGVKEEKKGTTQPEEELQEEESLDGITEDDFE